MKVIAKFGSKALVSLVGYHQMMSKEGIYEIIDPNVYTDNARLVVIQCHGGSNVLLYLNRDTNELVAPSYAHNWGNDNYRYRLIGESLGLEVA